MSYLQAYRHAKKIIPSAKTVFHNSRNFKTSCGFIRFDGLNHFIGSYEKKSRCALCGKQRNVNAPSVTLSCMITVYQLCMDLESDVL